MLESESSDINLGLQLYYCGNDGYGREDDILEVFINEVHQDGLVAQDGRIQEGDQIIQVKKQTLR